MRQPCGSLWAVLRAALCKTILGAGAGGIKSGGLGLHANVGNGLSALCALCRAQNLFRCYQCCAFLLICQAGLPLDIEPGHGELVKSCVLPEQRFIFFGREMLLAHPLASLQCGAHGARVARVGGCCELAQSLTVVNITFQQCRRARVEVGRKIFGHQRCQLLLEPHDVGDVTAAVGLQHHVFKGLLKPVSQKWVSALDAGIWTQIRRKLCGRRGTSFGR